MHLLSTLFGAAFTLGTAYSLGALLMRRRPAPPEILLAIGAAAESVLVFLLLTFHLAHWGVFLGLGAAAIFAAWRLRATLPAQDAIRIPRAAWFVFLPYGVWYLVNALAPETIADGITYHLGLPREYLRLGGFPDHITFYDVVPQGMEMLYTVAFAFGRHAAAKLVEFTFFLATIPLIFRLGRRLGATDLACLVAAVFYFCAPVAGITGSSSYNDAAGVFFLFAAFYLLLLGDHRYLLPAGALAGFCYAIKLPGLAVVAGAVLFVAVAKRRWKPVLLVAAGAGLMMAPWIGACRGAHRKPGRAAHEPACFRTGTSTSLPSRNWPRTCDLSATSRPAQVPWELAFGDHLTGTFGPLLFALPLGLLVLRRRQDGFRGRLLWAAVLLLALPWLTNTGARFLMPAVALAAIALGMALPRPVAWAAIGLQAILCWPHVLDAWETRYSFRLHEFPLAAAVGAESEPDYCKRRFEEYNVAQMIQRATPPDSRTLALVSVANAYLDREVAVSWQSAEADQLLDTLRLAGLYYKSPTYDWKAAWPEQLLRALRFRMPAGYQGEWDISEVQLFSGEDLIFNSPQWTLRRMAQSLGRPAGLRRQPGHPLAYLGNRSSRDVSGTATGPSAASDLGRPGEPHPGPQCGARGLRPRRKGQWHLLSNAPQAIPRPPKDIRLEAARAVRRAGFRYLLVPTGKDGNAPIGNVIVDREAEWGMESVGDAGRFHLLRIK